MNIKDKEAFRKSNDEIFKQVSRKPSFMNVDTFNLLRDHLAKGVAPCQIDINDFGRILQARAKAATTTFSVLGTDKKNDLLFDIEVDPIREDTAIVGVSYHPGKDVRLKWVYLSDGKDIIASSPQDIYIGHADTLDIQWTLPSNYVEGTFKRKEIVVKRPIPIGDFSNVELGITGNEVKPVEWYWDTDCELGNEHGQYALIKGKTEMGTVRHDVGAKGSGKAYRAFPITPVPFTLVGSTLHNTLREAKLMVERYHGLEDVPCSHQMFWGPE